MTPGPNAPSEQRQKVLSGHALRTESVVRPGVWRRGSRWSRSRYSRTSSVPVQTGVAVALAGADPQDAVYRADPDLPIADGAGVDRLGDRISHRPGRLVLDQDVDAELGQDEGVLIGGPARRHVPVLLAKAVDFGHGQPVEPRRRRWPALAWSSLSGLTTAVISFIPRACPPGTAAAGVPAPAPPGPTACSPHGSRTRLSANRASQMDPTAAVG